MKKIKLGEKTMSLSNILRTIIVGLSNGMVNYLVVAGIALVMGGLGLINFGQGAYYILGAYLCFTFTQLWGFGWGLLAAAVITFVIGYFIEITFRRLYGKHITYMLMFTMALAYIISDVMVAIWGYQLVSTPLPSALKGVVRILGVMFPLYYLFMIVIGALISILFFVMFYKTKLGMYFRAIISDREMVEALGINVNFLNSVMFAISIVLGGIAGALYSPLSGQSPKEGLVIFGNIMPILMIGGIRNLKGALPAAILVGLVNSFGAVYVPSIYGLLPFLLMIIVMMFKPQGLFTAKE